MKRNTLYFLVLTGFVLLICTSYRHGEQWIPVFMERSELEKSVSFKNEGRAMENPGKIYIRGTEIFVNEKYKGIHILDNSNPEAPVSKAFIVAPGCIDMAVKGNMIYLDNAVDLVAFDLNTRQVTERIRDFMPEHRSPDGRPGYLWDRPQNLILVGWKVSGSND